MDTNRRFTVKVPSKLLETITRRSKVNGRSRNGEALYLVDYALEHLDYQDAVITIDTSPKVQAGFYIDRSFFEELEVRAERLHRRVGPELVRLLTFAVKKIEESDLETIRSMVPEDQLQR